MNRRSLCVLAVLFLLCVVPPRGVCEEKPDGGFRLELRGHVTTLWTWLDSFNSSNTLNTNRLRLEAAAFCGKNLSLHLTNDFAAYTGNFVSTPAFDLIKNDQQLSYWNLSWGAYYYNSVFFQHSLYRAYLHYETDYVRMDAGKQRIAWGAMRYWRPTDFFNPVSPLQIETGERTGVDALRTQVPFSKKADLEMVYAPSRFPDSDTEAARFHCITGDYDLTFVGGRVRGSSVAGFTFDGYVGEGGFRGEVLRVSPLNRGPYYQWTLGADYTFPSSLTVSAEYLYNGGALNVPVNPYFFGLGFLETRNSRLGGIGLSYKLSPLVDASIFTSYDFDGRGVATSPRIHWNFRQNVDVDVGYTFFGGGPEGEYTGFPNALFSQVKMYF